MQPSDNNNDRPSFRPHSSNIREHCLIGGPVVALAAENVLILGAQHPTVLSRVTSAVVELGIKG
jgi:hypothetical protein